jgi:hypothetical protein
MKDGAFEFRNVTAGQYVIQVDRGRRNSSTEGGVRHTAGVGGRRGRLRPRAANVGRIVDHRPRDL